MKYELFNKNTQAIVYGQQGAAIQRMLDFDYVIKREKPSIAAVVNPNRSGNHVAFFGDTEIIIPMYTTIEEAVNAHPNADVMVNFASFRSAYTTTVEALNISSIQTVVVIAEGVPERRARQLIALAKEKDKMIIGPATVGGIVAGQFKIANTAGTIQNIIASKLHRPGCVGFVSKSGGMSNECYNIIAMNTSGLYEGIAIGGDKHPGSTLLDHILRYEANPHIKMTVVLGELGGDDEYEIADMLKSGKIKKPVVAWVTGTCAKIFPTSVQFGHAGAKADSTRETADAKNKALKEAGVVVPNSFDDFGEKIKQVYDKLNLKEPEEPEIPKLPVDYQQALKEGMIRKSKNIICSISDDRGEEATYHGTPISDAVAKNSLGYTIGLLWFKKQLPDYACTFLEKVLITVADHGPSVSGAHNAIVASRAGKDIVSSLCSGLLTIGPRFGGAIDGALKYFRQGKDSGKSAEEFVADMKKQGILIPGIGHRIKSINNPDKRVESLKQYAKKHFKKTKYLDFALEVEKVTTAKKGNLILNVDGCIGILTLDLITSCGLFSQEEIEHLIEIGCLNGFFVLGRSIGLIGHFIDQKRLQSRLYRHPWDDTLFLND